MKPKNELFMDAIEWLIDNGLAENQGDIAVKAGLGPNLISRIKNGHVKSVSDDAIRALCSRFEELNIDYLRGKSETISYLQQEPVHHSALDDSFVYEKAIKNIVAPIYEKMIANLEKDVADKDKQLARYENDLDAKNEEIKRLQARIQALEAENAILKNGDPAKDYLFPIGTAEPQDNKEHARV